MYIIILCINNIIQLGCLLIEFQTVNICLLFDGKDKNV